MWTPLLDRAKNTPWREFCLFEVIFRGPLQTLPALIFRIRQLAHFRAVATCAIKLKEKKEIAAGTVAFYFEKPADFRFSPGQYLVLSLIDPPETDAEGNDRTFSIASAPFEEWLIVATRMRDTAFKRVLRTLPVGAEINMRGPFGSFVLDHRSTRPAVFLVGGIGITPVRSIVLQTIRDKLSRPLYLFYSNRRPEDAAFLEEIQGAGKTNINYEFIGTMTEMAKSRQPWRGETGFISREMIARYVKDFSEPIYYVVGPPGMVMAMRNILSQARVNGDNVRTEEFAGY